MPIIPPSAAAPYDTVNTILNAARVRVNDAIASLGGDMLTNTQPFTQVMTNTAWRKMQNYLANQGFTRVKSEAIITGVPVVNGTDPATQVSLSWLGFWDGNALNTSVTLPADLIMPLLLWERASGQNGSFTPMLMRLDGLPTWPHQGFDQLWEWRNDAIYMPGATTVTDKRLRYLAYLQDFADAGTVNWYDQPVPIARCLDCFSNYIAAEFAIPRGDMDAQSYIAAAEAAAKKIFNREAQAKQRVTASRRPYGRRNYSGGLGMGY